MENGVWKIQSKTKDLAFEADGMLATLQGNEASAQSVRLTLDAWKGDFSLVPSHGTDYEQILGQRAEEDITDEVIREAIFQESRVSAVNELTITELAERALQIHFSGMLDDGEKINMEVTVGE